MAGSFKLEVNVAELERDLKTFAKRAYPFATKQALNDAAWDARKNMQENIRRRMTERNKWTKSSVRVNTEKGLNVSRQKSEVGSIEKYMVKQEDGGIERSTGKHGVAIPTGYSAGQDGARPRTKLPRRPNKIQNIQLTRTRTRVRNRKARNFLLVQEAAKRGIRFVFMDLGKRKGIFRVLGGKKNPRVKMLHDVSNKTVRIKPTKTLEPAVDKTLRRFDEMYAKALLFQLRRHGLYR